MQFTKMHGLGNDYVYVNGFQETIADPAALAQAVSIRRFSIGSDGLILVLPSDQADVRMRMFNADGSESQMCGNGVRCVAKYSFDHGLTAGREVAQSTCIDILKAGFPQIGSFREITVETGRGVLTLGLGIENGKVTQVCVDMGEPILTPGLIPVNLIGQQAVGIPFQIDPYHFLMTCVSMGNPHAIFFVPDVKAVPLEVLGPAIEKHQLFPQRVNVHFAQVTSPREVIVRTWERGSGMTLACGTGASAVCVAGVLASQTDRQITARLPGGDLYLQWHQADNHVYMAGPATEVYTGQWPD